MNSYQQTLDQKSLGILPYQRSSEKKTSSKQKTKAYFVIKKLSDKAKKWLENSKTTNWSEIIYKQNYTSKQKRQTILKKLTWTLLGLDEAREYCGQWLTKGCFNVSMHPKGLPFVRRTKRSCFRANCEKCWLEKWLARESNRATRRIEKYEDMFQKKGWRYKSPIHIVISPSWKDKELDYGELKQKVIFLLKELGIRGGMMIYHPFKFDKKEKIWKINPHFHIVGFGWLDVDLFQNMLKNKDSDNGKVYANWIVKNLGLRDSLHSTVYYQLSHAGYAKGIQSVTWFGELSYRSKYSKEISVEERENTDYCEFCPFLLVNCVFIGKGKPPPYEFEGSVLLKNWKPLETVDDVVERKENQLESIQARKKFEERRKERLFTRDVWLDQECKEASEKANYLLKLLEYCREKTIIDCSTWFNNFFINMMG